MGLRPEPGMEVTVVTGCICSRPSIAVRLIKSVAPVVGVADVGVVKNADVTGCDCKDAATSSGMEPNSGDWKTPPEDNPFNSDDNEEKIGESEEVSVLLTSTIWLPTMAEEGLRNDEGSSISLVSRAVAVREAGSSSRRPSVLAMST